MNEIININFENAISLFDSNFDMADAWTFLNEETFVIIGELDLKIRYVGALQIGARRATRIIHNIIKRKHELSVEDWMKNLGPYREESDYYNTEKFKKTWNQFDQYYLMAKNEMKNTNKIKGYEVFCVNTQVKVWISCYDWEFMSNV
jgi:uncharacterized protein YeaO (DUF488 family)